MNGYLFCSYLFVNWQVNNLRSDCHLSVIADYQITNTAILLLFIPSSSIILFASKLKGQK